MAEEIKTSLLPVRMIRNMRAAIRSEMEVEEKYDKTESIEEGKKLRKKVPRSTCGEWNVRAHRKEGVEHLKKQEETRVPELVPVRHERMAQSAFAFYRGSAAIMAADLAETKTTGVYVQACGDAHIANFGIFASPERRLVFDMNDFDETLPAPWEWDLKRLLTSIEICGRDRKFSEEERTEAVLAAAAQYRKAMRYFSNIGNLDVWYEHIDISSALSSQEDRLSPHAQKTIQKVLKKASNKNRNTAFSKFTEQVDGKTQIITNPPTIVPLRDMEKNGISPDAQSSFLGHLLHQYRLSLPRERRVLIDQYTPVDVARKVVGVGSVGMEAWIVVLEGADANDPLVLQIKEATESVMEPYAGKSTFVEHGRRVIEGQRAIQTAGDILAGWVRVPDKSNGFRDYYIRQLWDDKGSVDLEKITPDELTDVASLCAWTLAHAHAKTGNRHKIAGYLGKSKAFDQAMLAFAKSYADQNEEDYRMFLKSIVPYGGK